MTIEHDDSCTEWSENTMVTMTTIPNTANNHVGEAFGPLKTRVIQSPENEIAAKYERIAKAKAARQAQIAQRRAEEDRRFQQEMALPIPEAHVELTRVRAGSVVFDRRYQTRDRYDEGRARKIAREYDPHKMRPIEVNIRPDDPTETIWCLDGQHRVYATIMRCPLGEEQLLDARLHRVPYEQEAALFAQQHDNVKAVPHTMRFNAELEANNPEALARQAILDRLHLARGRSSANHTIATNTFLDCCRMKGIEATERGLNVILDVWDGSASSMATHIVKGVVWVVANRCDHPNWDERRLRTVLARADIGTIERDATSKNPRLTYNQQVSAVIVDLYNSHRKDQHLLAEWKPRNER